MHAVDIEDAPGGAGKVLRQIGDAGVNVELAYQLTGARILIGGSDFDHLKAFAHA